MANLTPQINDLDEPACGGLRRSTAGKIIGAATAAAILTLGIGAPTASADSCHGDIVGKNIASKWPFAHGDHNDFAPPKGGFVRWVETFGFEESPGAENQAIRDLCRS